MKNKVYSEKQSFWTWWLVILFVGLFVWLSYPFLLSDKTFTSEDWVGLGVLILVLMLLFVKLHTRIDKEGITIRFFPFVIKRTWSWDMIDSVYIKKYSIVDYGGWGYRVGKNGIAYNTKGNFGLQLILKNGARIMIGTQRPEEVKDIVHTYKQMEHENTH